jgi:hypothetical protein
MSFERRNPKILLNRLVSDSMNNNLSMIGTWASLHEIIKLIPELQEKYNKYYEMIMNIAMFNCRLDVYFKDEFPLFNYPKEGQSYLEYKNACYKRIHEVGIHFDFLLVILTLFDKLHDGIRDHEFSLDLNDPTYKRIMQDWGNDPKGQFYKERELSQFYYDRYPVLVHLFIEHELDKFKAPIDAKQIEEARAKWDDLKNQRKQEAFDKSLFGKCYNWCKS